MRSLLSIFLVVCLFNVSVHSAVADLAAVTAPEHHSVLVPQEANSKTKTVVDHLRSKISYTCSAIKDSFNTVTQTPTGFIITFMGMTVLASYAFLCTVVLLMSFMNGHSFAVQHTLFFSGPHTSFAIPDTCANPYFLSYHNLDLQIYQHLTQGKLSLTEFIPLCLNNAHHLMGLLGGAILQKLYHEYSGNNWWPFQEDAFNLLIAHGMPLQTDTISCDVKLAYGGEPDQIVSCQFEPLPDFLQNSVIAPNAHAKLWLIKAWHQPLDRNSLQLVVGTRPAEHLYLRSDTSPDYDRVDHHTRNEARRRMMQVMGMSLPEAIKDWFENALHWMNQAHDIATTLQAHQCPQPELSQALHNLTSSIFDAQQAVMNGTVRCDLRTEDQSLHIHGCAFDAKPTGYDPSTLCDTNANVQFPEMGALWLLPRQDAYSSFLMSMRPHRAPPAPTPILTTPVPTAEPQTPLPSTAEPTTSAPTQIPTTAAPTPAPTSVPTTVAPAKNTTTRLYWANQGDSSIWVSEVNNTNGALLNPRIYAKGDLLNQPYGLFVDEVNGFAYWGEPNRGMFVAEAIPTTNGLSNKAILLPSIPYGGAIYSIYMLPNGHIYWVNLDKLYVGYLNPAEPNGILFSRQVTLPPLSNPGLRGLFVNLVNQRLYVSDSRQYYSVHFSAVSNPFNGTSTSAGAKQDISDMIVGSQLGFTTSNDHGRVYLRNNHGTLYSAPFDHSNPVLITPEIMMKNETMFAFGGMSLVTDAKPWANATSKVYYIADYSSEDKIRIAIINRDTLAVLKERIFIQHNNITRIRSFFIDEKGQQIYYCAQEPSNSYPVYLYITNYTLKNPVSGGRLADNGASLSSPHFKSKDGSNFNWQQLNLDLKNGLLYGVNGGFGVFNLTNQEKFSYSVNRIDLPSFEDAFSINGSQLIAVTKSIDNSRQRLLYQFDIVAKGQNSKCTDSWFCLINPVLLANLTARAAFESTGVRDLQFDINSSRFYINVRGGVFAYTSSFDLSNQGQLLSSSAEMQISSVRTFQIVNDE